MTNPEIIDINRQIDDKPQEACGIVGFAPVSKNAVELAHLGVMSVVNRGQDGTGMAVFDPDLSIIKNLGTHDRAFKGGRLLSQFGESAVALGHVHYNTDEEEPERSLQPYGEEDFAFAHNGQFTNARRLASELGLKINGGSDSEIVSKIIASQKNTFGSLELALDETLPKLLGAFSVVLAQSDRLIAIRDSKGIRPLNLGRLADGGHGVSSETAVFDVVGGEFISPVLPGTYSIIDKDNIETHRWHRPKPSTCGLEFAYFSRPDSEIDGIGVAKARYHMGENLAEDYPLDVDLVIPMPDSGRHAATGYSHKLGIQMADGFYKSDVGRIFIKPGSRDMWARVKNNPIEDVVRGNRIALIDDSIIRGDTAKSAIKNLRSKGAREVHLLSTFPKVKFDCFYGMNMKQRDGFIAEGRDSREIADEIGADSVSYLSNARYKQAVGRNDLCMACTNGKYPESIEPEMVESEHIAH